MPLHVLQVFHSRSRSRFRSRSRNSKVRTDLSRTYTLSQEERAAQGYLERSDWANDIGILEYMLDKADLIEEIDRGQWSVQIECQKVLSYHFYDLDKEDQECCAAYLESIIYCQENLDYLLDEGQHKPVKDVVKHLESFKEQAAQLHGVPRHHWKGPGWLVTKISWFRE